MTLGDRGNPLVGHLQNQHKRLDAQRFRSLRMEFYQKPLFLELGIHLGRTHKQSNLPLQNEGQNLHVNRARDLLQSNDRAHNRAPNTLGHLETKDKKECYMLTIASRYKGTNRFTSFPLL